jgi:hypothetical protein
MSTQKYFVRFCTRTLSLFTIALFFSTPTWANIDPNIDIRMYAKKSDFIFKAKVTSIAYKNSEVVPRIDPNTGTQAIDEDGQPIFEDGSDLPHTFITFLIEQIYKGKAPGSPPSSYVTLQFTGGPLQSDPNKFLMASHLPLFDVNDRDFLLVERNTVKAVPLVRSMNGRFRIIRDVNDPTLVNKIYNEEGFEVVGVPWGTASEPNEVALGPPHLLEECNTHLMGTHPLRKVIVHPDDDSGEPNEPVRKGPQFTEAEFGDFLTQIVQETHTPEELANLPPVVSADITQPFFAASLPDLPPPTGYDPEQEQKEVIKYPRPWLDLLPPEEKAAILEAERVERQLLELAGGNPVLPETPCEISILMYGRMPGDISGPKGKPDCRVNFFDVGALAGNWLECNDPNDPTCI